MGGLEPGEVVPTKFTGSIRRQVNWDNNPGWCTAPAWCPAAATKRTGWHRPTSSSLGTRPGFLGAPGCSPSRRCSQLPPHGCPQGAQGGCIHSSPKGRLLSDKSRCFPWLPIFITIPNKGNAKERSNYHVTALIPHAKKFMLKTLQGGLQQYMNWELPDIQAGFRKGRGTRDQIANICWIIEKNKGIPEKHIPLYHWLC